MSKRRRVGAHQHRLRHEQAHTIADGVYAVTRDLAADRRLYPLPLQARGPVQYACEQMAYSICARKGIPHDRDDDVALYLVRAMNDYMVALYDDFDVANFEKWLAEYAQLEARIGEVGSSG